MAHSRSVLFDGGGVASGTTGGMFTALVESNPDDWVKSVNDTSFFGTSGGYGSIPYFLAHWPLGLESTGQVARKVWTRDIIDRNFVNLANLRSSKLAVDVEHLTEHSFRVKNPLPMKQLRSTLSAYGGPAIDIDTGREVWLGNSQAQNILRGHYDTINVDNEDPYVVMRAIKSMFLLDNRWVEIAGRRLADGVGVRPIPLPASRIMPKRSLLLLTGDPEYPLRAATAKAFESMCGYAIRRSHGALGDMPLRVYPSFITRGFRFNRLMRRAKELEQQGRLKIVTPLGPVGGNSELVPHVVRRNFQSGYDAVTSRSDELNEFMFG